MGTGQNVGCSPEAELAPGLAGSLQGSQGGQLCTDKTSLDYQTTVRLF